ncbi:MAG: MerR family DNA-binding transcriptional regulator [Candidatus Hodarchaeales archaeon]
MYISIGKTAYMLGVSATSLRSWDSGKLFQSNFRTTGGHRRYKLSR